MMTQLKWSCWITIGMIWWNLLSCTTIESIDRDPDRFVPDAYPFIEGNGKIPCRWWQSLQNRQLNRIMEDALAGNFSIQKVKARLDQARAVALKTGANRYPGIEGTAGYSRSETITDTFDETGWNAFSLGITTTYEIDLWGRIRSETDAAALDVSATGWDIQTAAMTLVAGVASRWVQLVEQVQQKILLQQQLETAGKYLDLVKLRFENAVVSALDVYQQEQNLYAIQSAIPLVDARIRELILELNLMRGKPADTAIVLPEDDLPELIPLPQTGVPADLLKNRPDIQASWVRVQAADKRVAAAIADRLPAIRLTGSAKLESDTVEALFDNWLGNLAAGIIGPIFDGKRRLAEVDRTRALARERVVAFQETLMEAITEVTNAWQYETQQQAHMEILKKQLIAARKTLDLARQRYMKGVSDYLPVLSALTTFQRLERDMVRARRDLWMYRIDLYRALGGQWNLAHE